MRIAFFDTKPYDRLYFDEGFQRAGMEVAYFEYKLRADTAVLAQGFDAVCAFVNDVIDEKTLDLLDAYGVHLLALRCAGYNNVDFRAAFGKVHVVRVPAYSPRAVAEHAAALLLSMNRKIHKAYARTREGNFTLNGLMGIDLYGKMAGVVGTGQIGRCFIDICKGFGMQVMAYDPYPAPNADIAYVSMQELFERSDIISLHCPLTPDTWHIVNKSAIQRMKPDVFIINTSRGGLIETEALIEGLRNGKIGGAGLDVYEEESDYFYEDLSGVVITDDNLLRLISYPNVLVTSHQAFLTKEALSEIAEVTIKNLMAYQEGVFLENEVCYDCDKKETCTVKADKAKCW